MSCKGDIVVGVEEVLFLLPSNLFNELFLDRTCPFPQSNRGRSYYDRKPRMWYEMNHYSSLVRPSGDTGAARVKPRGTGVFLPERPVSSSEEKRPTKKPCPVTSSHSRQVFLPKEWAY
ncbi:unnamed protein product [Arabidopsis lyrata]|uniref:Predicted protein n=1 Tax=Arabidopsis lyrata subsp. lyrata TaxID=81972 RepID=D7KCY8_ARALL|nr:uncharacterized protein LOC9329603 [Arabidopsis lyrata subsp. lyrata]EFH67043.1 predicted protein [Arabidopsis lyrata subsp. lyrata]CAH8253809.1 unnamed protein product [Arabidopsis lyrata]|eukprot:XP_002890784.1 uncharacterized protein LOC9329603 [Arabidopsis lyrata subsp. lyrata]